MALGVGLIGEPAGSVIDIGPVAEIGVLDVVAPRQPVILVEPLIAIRICDVGDARQEIAAIFGGGLRLRRPRAVELHPLDQLAEGIEVIAGIAQSLVAHQHRRHLAARGRDAVGERDYRPVGMGLRDQPVEPVIIIALILPGLAGGIVGRALALEEPALVEHPVDLDLAGRIRTLRQILPSAPEAVKIGPRPDLVVRSVDGQGIVPVVIVARRIGSGLARFDILAGGIDR